MEKRKLRKKDVVTGVLQNNRCSYLSELDGDDIFYEEALNAYLAENPEDPDANGFEYCNDERVLYVGMKKGADGLYDADPDEEFSAIIDYAGHYTTQVINSRYGIECHRCSPCYPNQGDIDTPGNSYIAFCLSPDMWDETIDEFDKTRIFEIEWID